MKWNGAHWAAMLTAVGFLSWLGPGGLSGQETGRLEDAELLRIGFLDPDRGWAVGDRGAVWHTSDGGLRWSLQRTETSTRLESLCILDDRQVWVAGGDIRPYSLRSQGVVLRTSDGGLHWNNTSHTPHGDAHAEKPIPWIRELRMFDAKNGLAAGDCSRLLGASLFSTADGGRTWKPQPGVPPRRWLAANFINPFVGLLVEEQGAPLVWRQRVVEAGRGAREERRPARILAAGSRDGWCVGERGLVLWTNDAGRTWGNPPAPLPAVARDFDFRAVAVHGERVWIAGTPGSLIFHSSDAGRTWQVQETGSPLPINDLAFLDADRGWSAGPLGTIMATRDGGRSWRRQRGAAPRSAVLLLAAGVEQFDYELAARLSGDDRALVAAVSVLQPRANGGFLDESDAVDRARRGASLAGIAAVEVSRRFPLPSPELRWEESELARAWGASAEAGRDALRDELVRRLLTWRPDVVIVCGGSEDTRERVLLHRLLVEAVTAAADERRESTLAAGLTPWRVSKVFARSEPGEAVVVGSQWSAEWGESLADRAGLARSYLQSEIQAAEPSKSYRLLHSRLPSARAGRDFLTDLGVASESFPRRAGAPPPSGSLEELRRMSQRRRMVEAIVQRGVNGDLSGAAWLAQLDDLLHGLNPSGAGALLLETAERLRRRNQLELAEEVWSALLSRFPQEPAAEAAAFQLLRHAASRELQAGRRPAGLVRLMPPQLVPAVEEGGVAFAVGSPEGEVRPAAAMVINGDRERERRGRLIDQLERGYPGLMALPQSRLLLAAAARETRDAGRVTRGGRARQIYESLAGGDPTDPATLAAQGELWLLRPGPVGPKPFLRCPRTEDKPFLDGRLDEPFWRDAVRLELRSPRRDDHDWPAVVYLARDAEYFYFAAECASPPGTGPIPETAERTRDGDLSREDRVELLLDLDRDYSTCLRLAVDRRGWTADLLDDRPDWNPGWYVARSGEGTQWRFEAALPLRELPLDDDMPLDAWGLGVQRIVPGRGWQNWHGSSTPSSSPVEFGYLRFE